jgi:hypothetical protein
VRGNSTVVGVGDGGLVDEGFRVLSFWIRVSVGSLVRIGLVVVLLLEANIAVEVPRRGIQVVLFSVSCSFQFRAKDSILGRFGCNFAECFEAPICAS